MRPAGWAFESSWLLTGAQELRKNSSTISFTGKAISPWGFVQAALQNVSNTIKYGAQGQATGTLANTHIRRHRTGLNGHTRTQHHAMISTQAQSNWQMCTWRQLCHLHTLALAEHVGPVRNSRASLSPFFKTSFSTACPLLSICLNDLWTPGLGMCLFAVSQQSKPPSSECFESLPCCLWTEIRKKHFGTHDAGRSGAGIASFWVVCCFNNVTPPSFWTFVFQCSSLYPYRVSPLPFKSLQPPWISFTPRQAITSCTKRTK